MTCRVSVSIINYRTGQLTLDCLNSVLVAMEGIAGHVAIVDNFSQDGSAEQIAGWIAAHPDAPVTLVRSETNSGFSGGHNQGISAREAEFYLVLNSDAVLRPSFLREILKEADRHPQAGYFAPRIEWEDGSGAQTSCFRFPSPASEFIRGANTGFVTKALKSREVALGPEPDPDRIDWASFACILLRHEMVAKLGPMDEGYFLYFEDAEYCLRGRRAGWDLVYVPRAVAVHFRGGRGPVKALARARKRMPAYYYASRTRFFYQAHGRLGLWAANLCWFLGRTLAQARRLVGKPVNPRAEREPGDLWINAANPLGPRRAPWEDGA